MEQLADDGTLGRSRTRVSHAVRLAELSTGGESGTGQAPLGDADLHEVTDADRACAALEVEAIAGRLTDLLPHARRVANACTAAGWMHHEARARLVEAEASLLGGCIAHVDGVAPIIRDVLQLCERQGLSAEALHALFLRASLERITWRESAAAATLEEIQSRAFAQARLVEVEAARLAREPGARTSMRSAGARLAARLCLLEERSHSVSDDQGRSLALTPAHRARLDLSGYALAVELDRGSASIHKQTVVTARKEALWRLLVALSDRVGEAVPVDDLARAAWNIEYHPLRHRSRVVVSIKRLRTLLGVDCIVAGRDSYALRPFGGWAIARPAAFKC